MVDSNNNRRELREIAIIIKGKGKGFIVELVELVDVMAIKVTFLKVSMIADNFYLELSQYQE